MNSGKYRRRTAETEVVYRQVEICLHRVSKAAENPLKLRFEVAQLQKQLRLLEDKSKLPSCATAT